MGVTGLSPSCPSCPDLQARQVADLERHIGRKVSHRAHRPLPDTLRRTGGSLFFFHPDHLGSGTLLTDANGDAYQFFVNLPFGEMLAEQKATGAYSNAYKFTGKELDSETGLYYLGARYYSPVDGIFLSVDVLSGAPNNIGWTPYHYTWNNPVKFIDPTGMHGESTHVDEVGNVIAEYDDGDNGVYIHANGTTKNDINRWYSCDDTSAGGRNIGSLGGNIDIGRSGIYSNKLANSTNEVLSESFTFGNWYNNVKGGGDWDLKANKKTIWGVAWAYDANNKTSTSFSTPNLLFEDASDFGNYHAGFTGSIFGINVPVQKIGAGVVEQFKDLRKGDLNQVVSQFTQMFKFWEHNAFMDETDDYYWNTQGMSDALYLKTKLNLSSSNLLRVQKMKK